MKHFWTLLIILFLVDLTACTPIDNGTPTIPPDTQVPSTPTPALTSVPGSDAAFLPNSLLTPGEFNPDVTQGTIGTTICVRGWTATVRPPASYTDALKIKQLANPAYGDTADQNTADYEEDHFIPLDLGGNPTSEGNLWPQPRNTQPYNAGTKDQLEAAIVKLVCNGSLSLADARSQMQTDWVAAYRKYVGQGVLPALAVPTEP